MSDVEIDMEDGPYMRARERAGKRQRPGLDRIFGLGIGAPPNRARGAEGVRQAGGGRRQAVVRKYDRRVVCWPPETKVADIDGPPIAAAAGIPINVDHNLLGLMLLQGVSDSGFIGAQFRVTGLRYSISAFTSVAGIPSAVPDADMQLRLVCCSFRSNLRPGSDPFAALDLTNVMSRQANGNYDVPAVIHMDDLKVCDGYGATDNAVGAFPRSLQIEGVVPLDLLVRVSNVNGKDVVKGDLRMLTTLLAPNGGSVVTKYRLEYVEV